LAALVLACTAAQAQRSSEDAVAEALDAFGSVVGREQIGLYSMTNARGLNPQQAGNVRIEGLYFDQVDQHAGLTPRLARGSSVRVGIAAQGYLFPAPTGVGDYQLRLPGNELLGSVLLGDATYGVSYAELDAQLPLIHDVLSMGAGVGYTRDPAYDTSRSSHDWNAGWIARWQPNDSLQIVPFWGISKHSEFEKKANITIDNSGFPRFYKGALGSEPWAHSFGDSTDLGTTARLLLGGSWTLAAGLFRSELHHALNYVPFLNGTDGRGQGDYTITALPANTAASTSGELRLSHVIHTGALLSAIYLRIAGRDSSIESVSGDERDFGTATLTEVPQVPMPDFNPGPIGDVQVHQVTPGIAYRGSWLDKAQLTLALQKVFYHRTVYNPGAAPTSDQSSPWLPSAAATVSLSKKLLAYGSYTRGFEEVGTAPLNAANRTQPLPAQQSWQLDGGVRYELHPRLQLVAGVFEIQKPYFSLDPLNVFRNLGRLTNRGVELSLTGALTQRLFIVSGIVLIDSKVHYSSPLFGFSEAPAIGPVPAFMSTYLQYHPAAIRGLTLGATVQTNSSRYASYPDVNLPPFTTFGADVHYTTRLLGNNATFWLQMYNAAAAYGLMPSPTGQITPMDFRRFELSLTVDF
jgi:iron complex outermembrane receptor protein